jgi:acetolactate synthase I/III small subunit
MNKQKYTIIVYSENNIGLLNRITIIFTRRHINIESLTVSSSEIEGLSRFTIIIDETAENTRKVVTQIEKQIEVVKAFYYLESETISQEVALYKVNKDGVDKTDFEQMVNKNSALIVADEQDYFVVVKTGHFQDTGSFVKELKEKGYKLMQFVRSGSVAVTKTIMPVSEILEKFESINS